MKLPFTGEQFLELFRDYNQSVFPLQIVFYLLAAVVIFLALKPVAFSGRLISAILAFLWLWMGIVYHLLFFTSINKAAYLFGSLFIVQGLLFVAYGVAGRKLTYSLQVDGFGVAGAILAGFALAVYPLLGYYTGHGYPLSPTLGVPCPTTIFTFGVLLWSQLRVPKAVLVIPFLWSLPGFSAATTLGITEDTALVIAGLVATGLLWFRRQQRLA